MEETESIIKSFKEIIDSTTAETEQVQLQVSSLLSRDVLWSSSPLSSPASRPSSSSSTPTFRTLITDHWCGYKQTAHLFKLDCSACNLITSSVYGHFITVMHARAFHVNLNLRFLISAIVDAKLNLGLISTSAYQCRNNLYNPSWKYRG